MSHDSTSGGTPETTDASVDDQLRGPIHRAQGIAASLESELPPHYTREVQHLETDLDVLERWADDVEDEGVEAMAGAETVADTAAARVAYLQEELGQSDDSIATRLAEIGEAIEEIQAIVEDQEITTTVFVTYVNRAFTARYVDNEVTIERILLDAGRENVDELGLFPLDGLFGKSVEDLAFPHNQQVDLSDDHRTYWKSTSDGGQIA